MILTEDGKVPVHWWTHAKNFGDLLSPWLVRKITHRDVAYVDCHQINYTTIGSILGHATDNSILWGTGAFGTEKPRRKNQTEFKRFSPNANYTAVRGPLTRNILETKGIKCPRVYGDPALLTPRYFTPHSVRDEEKYTLGIILRWSEKSKQKEEFDPRVKVIYLDTDQIEETIQDICSCHNILTTSLHGLIMADAYGIPNAWLYSDTPTGLEFKYWDYLTSVSKVRKPYLHNLSQLPQMGLERIMNEVNFDGRHIDIDLDLLEAACPFTPGREPDVIAPNYKIRKKWWLFGPQTLTS
jgi:pyruvyltransferase